MDSNLKECKACGNEISKKAKKCPKCGEDQRNFFMRHKFLTGIIIIIIISIIGSNSSDDIDQVASEDDGKTSQVEETSEVEEVEKEEEKTEFKVGETISYKDFDLVFENQRTIVGTTGDEYLILDATILSKKDNLKFFGDIQGVNTENEIINDTIPIVSEDIGDSISTAWLKTLNKGQKAKGYVAFDQDIEFIEVRSSSFSNDVINIIID